MKTEKIVEKVYNDTMDFMFANDWDVYIITYFGSEADADFADRHCIILKGKNRGEAIKNYKKITKMSVSRIESIKKLLVE